MANLCFCHTISEQYGVTDPSLCLPCQQVWRCLCKLKDVFSNIIVYCTTAITVSILTIPNML